ncbi:MAG: amino acid ABC transporter substrate-binding protein [Cyanobacteria bacterium J069]|nr:MAG: amino acid ABC transporter substrate-binding protein [Cyanobacteria bacterium J069]
MRKRRQSVCLGLLLWLGTLAPAGAQVEAAQAEALAGAQVEARLDKISRTGILAAGVRTDAAPVGALDESGEPVGYAVDLLRWMQADLSRRLGKSIQLELVPTTAAEQFAQVSQGGLDIACGSSSITLSRESKVDFSVGYFVTGTQFLLARGQGLSSNRIRIGGVAGTTNEALIRSRLPLARIVPVSDRPAGLILLQQGRIDALASDGILLEGLRRSLPDPDAYEVVPSQPFSREVYGCLLPKQDLPFRTQVNHSLMQFMAGVLSGEAAATRLFDAWFGPQGAVPVDADPTLAHFQQVVQQREQQP